MKYINLKCTVWWVLTNVYIHCPPPAPAPVTFPSHTDFQGKRGDGEKLGGEEKYVIGVA